MIRKTYIDTGQTTLFEQAASNVDNTLKMQHVNAICFAQGMHVAIGANDET